MIIYENGEYTPCTYKVTLKNNEKEEVHYTNDKEYWEDMVAKHNRLTDLAFEEFEMTDEQQKRFEEIKNIKIPEGFQAQVREYVIDISGETVKTFEKLRDKYTE